MACLLAYMNEMKRNVVGDWDWEWDGMFSLCV